MSDAGDFADGDRVTATIRITPHSNAAAAYYYIIEVPMFVHTLPDTGERVLLVEESYRADPDTREKHVYIVDGLPLDLADPRIEAIEARSR